MLYSDPHYFNAEGVKKRLFEGVKRVVFLPEAGHAAPGFMITKGTASESNAVEHTNYWAEQTSVNAASRHMRYMRPDICLHPRPSSDEWIARRKFSGVRTASELDSVRNDDVFAVRRIIAKALLDVPTGPREGSVNGLDYSETHKAMKDVWPELAQLGWRQVHGPSRPYCPGMITIRVYYTADSSKPMGVWHIARHETERNEQNVKFDRYACLNFCAYSPDTRLFVYHQFMTGQPFNFSNSSETVGSKSYGYRYGSGVAGPVDSKMFRVNRRALFDAEDDVELINRDPLSLWSSITGEFDSIDLESATSMNVDSNAKCADPSLYGTALRIYGFDESVDSVRMRMTATSVEQTDDPDCWIVKYRREPEMSFVVNSQKLYESMVDFTLNVDSPAAALEFTEGLKKMDGYAIHATYFTPQPMSKNVLTRTKIYADIKKADKMGELNRKLDDDENGNPITLNTMNKKVNRVIDKYRKIGIFVVPVKDDDVNIPRGPLGTVVFMTESVRAAVASELAPQNEVGVYLIPPGGDVENFSTWVTIDWADVEEKIDDGHMPDEYREVFNSEGQVVNYTLQPLSIESREALNNMGVMEESLDSSVADPAYNLLPEDDDHSLSPYEHMETVYPKPLTGSEGAANAARTFAFVGTEGYDDLVQIAARAIYS